MGNGPKNGAGNTAPNSNAIKETEEEKALRIKREDFEAEKAEFEANKKAEIESNKKNDAEAEKLKAEREDFEAEKAQLKSDKADHEAGKVDAEKEAKANEEAELDKKQKIDEYQERVRSTNREVDHIDFHKTGIKFFGDKSLRVGKPTAKAPTQRKVNSEVIDVK